MLGRVVSGSRTWMWTIAAPALAASMADVAICCGVTGTAGFFPGVSADPVTAHEIITLRAINPPPIVAALQPSHYHHGPTRWKQSRANGVPPQTHSGGYGDDPPGPPRNRVSQHRQLRVGRKPDPRPGCQAREALRPPRVVPGQGRSACQQQQRYDP